MKILLLFPLFVACATTYGPYGHEAVYGGYQEEKIGENKYLVSFHSNNMTGLGTTRSYAYKRVREYCRELNKDDFRIIKDTDYQGAGDSKVVTITFSCS